MSDQIENLNPENNDASIEFKPIDTQTDNEIIPEQKTRNLDRLALDYNLVKWILGTFLFSVITITINYYFKDRAVGIQEITAYEKYTTDIMVLNENPVKKRMLAQFFANAAPSWSVRCGWMRYYQEIDSEYKIYIHKKDSLKHIVDCYHTIGIEQLNDFQRYKLKEIEAILEIKSIQENAPPTVPLVVVTNNVAEKQVQEIFSKKLTANDYEKLGYENLKDKKFEEAKTNFQTSFSIYPMLHNVAEISKLLTNTKNPENDKDWKSLYEIVLKKYSWGMSEEVRKTIMESQK